MAHTPGPWWVDGPGEGIEVHDTFGRTASVWGEGGKESEAWANARLIAAAPELLAALKFIVNDCPEPGEAAQLTAHGYNLACSAIAKAEGRTDDQ